MGVVKFGFDEARTLLQNSTVDDEDILFELSYLGEQMCNHARNVTKGHATGGYDDQTGNLRSSIGYRIFKDAQPIKDGGMARVNGTKGNGSEGENKVVSALDTFANSPKVVKNGWTLLVVAGMEYAKYVEDKGYNVLYLTGIELEKKIAEIRKRYGL